jgi:hypothetical protein
LVCLRSGRRGVRFVRLALKAVMENDGRLYRCNTVIPKVNKKYNSRYRQIGSWVNGEI